MFDIMQQMQLQDLHFHQDSRTNLQAVVAIHSTRLGPALGGCRIIDYSDTESAVLDAARLAKGMSYKAALADIPHGGGKAVIIKPKSIANRQALFEAFGRFIDSLRGNYITAVDSGTCSEDMDWVANQTQFVTSTTTQGNPSPYTAQGVIFGIKAAVKHHLNKTSLEGLQIAIQGLGNVGKSVAEQLHQMGAQLIVADINPDRVQQIHQLTGATIAESNSIHRHTCDVFAPCALSNTINSTTIDELSCGIIAGSANNQLSDESMGRRLLEKGITYAPDYAINAGGLIYASLHHQHVSTQAIDKKIAAIGVTLSDIFQQMQATNTASNFIANRLAEAKLQIPQIHKTNRPLKATSQEDRHASHQHNAVH